MLRKGRADFSPYFRTKTAMVSPNYPEFPIHPTTWVKFKAMALAEYVADSEHFCYPTRNLKDRRLIISKPARTNHYKRIGYRHAVSGPES